MSYSNNNFYQEKRSKKHPWELIKGIVKCGSDFCVETSIHGFSHVAASGRHWSERLLWILIIVAGVWGAVGISLGQWQRYNEKPTVMTLGKDFRSWRFSLPALTTCEENRCNYQKMNAVIRKLWNVTSEDDKHSYYSNFVNTVANSDLYHLEAFQEFQNDDSLKVDLYKLAIDVMPDLQVKATWSEGTGPKWVPVMTEVGACYVTNSLAIADSAITVNSSSIFRRSATNESELLPITCKYSSMSCYVILEMPITADTYIHSPYDIADVTETPSRTFVTLNRFTEISVMETKCGQGVRDLKPRRRGCLFLDEPTDVGKNVYSVNNCRRSCRNELAIKLCGCKPFYNFYEAGPQCTPAGMFCLASHTNRLINLADFNCACFPQCIDAVYREISTEDQIWDRGPFLTRASIRYTLQAPRTRYTREIVFHFEDLVVSFGGAAGLFLGASFISFVEILYFIIEKLCGAFTGNAQRKGDSKISKPTLQYEKSQIQELNRILEEHRKYEV